MNNNAILLSLLLPFLLAGSFAAQYGYGTSSISLNPSAGSVAAGSSASTAYTVSLATGNTWGTTLSVQDSAALSSDGITVSISNPSGEPPFSGTATISTSASTAAGSYNVTFVATEDDPSSSPSTYTLRVTSQASTSTATTTGSSTSQSSSAPTSYSTSGYTTSTRSSGYGSGGNASGYGSALTSPAAILSILAIIALFVVIYLAFKFA